LALKLYYNGNDKMNACSKIIMIVIGKKVFDKYYRSLGTSGYTVCFSGTSVTYDIGTSYDLCGLFWKWLFEIQL